ncbi:MAG: hypothetical protein FWC83_01890, partial [Alphaproteobacteria bacterium]|nr:hypothetical protein [Alphaproteobacteria bacterium]
MGQRIKYRFAKMLLVIFGFVGFFNKSVAFAMFFNRPQTATLHANDRVFRTADTNANITGVPTNRCFQICSGVSNLHHGRAFGASNPVRYHRHSGNDCLCIAGGASGNPCGGAPANATCLNIGPTFPAARNDFRTTTQCNFSSCQCV